MLISRWQRGTFLEADMAQWRMGKQSTRLQTNGNDKPKYPGGEFVEAYCMKCRANREMKNIKAVRMKNGKPGTQGICIKCGTRMFRIGKA